MTVGKVQKEIRVGMSGADVAQALVHPISCLLTKNAGRFGYTTKSQLIVHIPPAVAA
jgi:hypothetical protein